MRQLAEKYEFVVEDCGVWPQPVYAANYNNKGILSPEWTFYLHSAHCRFDNVVTGQAIEVKYTERPEFGCLDGCFFYSYMQTTERFKPLAKWFVNHTNVYNAIEILAAEGTLTEKSSRGFGTL